MSPSLQSIHDIRQEENLRCQGDSLRIEREIRHWCYFSREADRRAFVDQIRPTFGGTIEVVRQYECPVPESDSTHYIVQLCHFGRPDHKSVQPITFGLAQLSQTMAGNYDGWETEVIPSDRQTTPTRVNDHVSVDMAGPLVKAVRSRDYGSAAQLLRSALEDDRERLVYGFACSSDAVAIAAQWATQEPANALAHLLLGASMLVTGWRSRGSQYAEHVEESAWIRFLATIRDAHEPLTLAANLDPALPDPFGWLIQYELGSGTDLERLEALFHEGCSRSPLHWPVHFKYAMAITEKWYGNHDLTFHFAQAVSDGAPSPSNLHILVAIAYAEFALDGGADARDQINAEAHRQAIVEALYKWLDATPDTIQEKIADLSGGFAAFGMNHFAVACYLCGAILEASTLTNALNGEIESLPWSWIGETNAERQHPELVYDRVCSELAALA